ncbi:cupin domain-containing protein [Allostreptomyces psammosilenae]|uniref:Quercetin dioxygenase-like cupin family protein n=1 Tax=Allostreptomyces psammosilenae TaxID=1892865 RepID=A0A853A2D1_9ACTN|nr:cupin domain-containing protein [Allostreptomyces psammosilenae]NYI04672.1 quercetin dioxygenase-like cupin family protein [Allostreptomyces psammosilenae]
MSDVTERTGTNGLPPELLEPWAELGVELLVDEPHVKSWMEVIKPGAAHPTHTHRYPFVTVVVAGGEGRSWTPDGELIQRMTLRAGEARYSGAEILPLRHHMTNASDSEIVLVTVELRFPGPVI